MQRSTRIAGLAIALSLAAIVISLASLKPRAPDPRWMAPDSLAIVLDDTTGQDGPDAIALMTVLSSSRTVTDSTIACAIYQTADKRIGLMTPALVVRRFSPDSVQPLYDRDVAGRCLPLLEAYGLRMTAATVHPLIDWSIENKSRESRRARGRRSRA